MNRTPLARLLLPLPLLASAPALALQVVEARDGVAADAVLSNREPTRIRIEGAAITDVFGNIHSSNCAAGPAAAGVSIAQVVPSPTQPIAAVQACARALQAAGVKTPMNTTHLEACFGAQILAEGLRRAARAGTARALRDALASLGTYDLGGFTVRFRPGDPHASSFVELAMVTRDGRMVR